MSERNSFSDSVADEAAIVEQGIAIVGMSGRFPGSQGVRGFWRNLCQGVDSISHFSSSELEDSYSAEIRASSDYVPARSILENVDMFDAEFFGMLPREAALTDPQHRIFLECCWEALEDAGYDPAAYPGLIGVFAGCSFNTYLLRHVCGDRSAVEKFTSEFQVGSYQELVGALQDFVATRVSYKFDLKGPAIDVQTACSTSLVAIAQACQSLSLYQSDMALAGGVSITHPQKRGYLSLEGGMVSPDGRCRPFDADAGGTVFGSGSGVVLLKRLEDAVADGDHIYAVILGHALNNDGSGKAGFTAPSVDGQASVIAAAHAVAGVSARDIGYIECHGTATPLGDPIEFAGLVKAFHETTHERRFCFLGSAKANVGHLDAAAGVTGVIKAAMTLREGKIPALLNYNAPNPHIDLESSPFKINKEILDWPRAAAPRRAGVSAFGVGGTNAHIVMQQAPERLTFTEENRPLLLVMSGRTPSACQKISENLLEHLRAQPDASLADVAWTLQIGRREFEHGRVVVARDVQDAIASLAGEGDDRQQIGARPQDAPRVYFMFPGQGAQFVGMGRGLYRQEPKFAEAFDLCADILRPALGLDLREIVFCDDPDAEAARARLTDTGIAQPAIFSIEYALAQLWMSWGVLPSAMIGHSIGEFVAATLSGVFSLEDALTMVAARGRLMQQAPRGAMLSVRLSEDDLRARLSDGLSFAAVNAPSICVVSGPLDEIGTLESALQSEKIVTRRLVTSHAFHSAMMDGAVEEFGHIVASVRRNAPRLPILSTATGEQLSDAEATDPSYWAQHMRKTVRFSAAIAKARAEKGVALLEVGPGNTLNILARQHTSSADQAVVSSLGGPGATDPDSETILQALGALWLAGVKPDWRAVHGARASMRRRVSLPTYPFERKRFWIDPPVARLAEAPVTVATPSQPSSNSSAGELSMNYQPKTSDSTLVDKPTPAAGGNGSQISAVRASLVQLFEELSGMDLGSAGMDTSFVELGFDSLFLTQVTRALKNKFGLKITFRQLLDDLATFDALAKYVQDKAPPGALETAEAQQTSPPTSAAETATATAQQTSSPAPYLNGAAGPVGGGLAAIGAPALGAEAGSVVERVLREQMQVMSQIFASQLTALRGDSSLPQAAASVVSPRIESEPAAIAANPPAPQPAAAEKSKTNETQGSSSLGPYKPLQTARDTGVTELQRAKLEELIARFTERTKTSKSITQQHRRRLADPRVVSGFRENWKELVYPITVSRSKGSRLWDVDGNEYIDLLNGFGPIMFGHRPDFIEQALREQLSEGIEIGPQTPLAGEIAEIFCDMTGNDRMTFCNTGSEAVMAALRVSRTVTGRDKVVIFSGDYHGMFDEVLIKAARNKSGAPGSTPIAPGIPSESVANMIALDYGAPESLKWIEENASELAAVIVEPVQSRRPNHRPVEFLKQLREITLKSSTALIFDEVVTGFRTHPGGCQALFGIRADMATYGKVIGGGMPIGILAGKAEFMDALDGGFWRFGDDSVPEVGVTFFAGTFVRHPLTLAAVKAVLNELKTQGPALQERLAARTTDMLARINAILDKYEIPTKLNNFTSFFYFSFPPTEKFSSIFYYLLREQGVHVLEGFPCFLTTAHSDEDIDRVVRAFEIAANEARAATLFGSPQGAASISTADANAPIGGLIPMTEPQREIFLAAMLGDDVSCAFNESLSVYFDGNLNIDALQGALNALTARHEALSATVATDGVHLSIKPHASFDLGRATDLSGLPEQERNREFERLLAEDARTPFNLAEGPLYRAELLRLSERRHALRLTFHHIICDGWSSNVLLSELGELYSAKVENRAASLPPVQSFAEYAIAQSHSEDPTEDTEIESYWLEQFKNPPALLELPTDRPRGSVRTYAGATLRRRIGRDAYKNLKQFGGKQGASLFATLFACFNALLYRLTRQSDIVVAVPMAGQSLVDGRSLVGHCVNFLPLRTQVTPMESFETLLKYAKNTVLDAVEHQRYTYGTLIRKLNLVRDPSRLPLTELQFNVEQLGGGVTFSGIASHAEPNPKAAVNSDIFVNIIEGEDGLTIDCDYNTDLYDESTISEWLGAFETLLTNASSNGSQTIEELTSALSIGARKNAPGRELSAKDPELLASWNDTNVEYAGELCIVRRFEAIARRQPQHPATVFNGESIDYATLESKAARLAAKLREMGVSRGQRVGYFGERCRDLLVGIMGILKAGAVYVPIDPTHPRERVAFIIEDAGLAAAITQSKWEKNLDGFNVRRLVLDDPDLLAGTTALDPEPLDDDDLAYVIYTSGTTGMPKGVMVHHGAVRNQLQWMQATYDLQSNDRFMHKTPLTFDVSIWEIFWPLMAGATIVIAQPEGHREPAYIADLINKEGITTLQFVPSMLQIFIENIGVRSFPSLKHVIVIGEALSNKLMEQFFQCFGVELNNLYGPTEATIAVTSWACSQSRGSATPVPIGRPIANTQIYILDENRQRAPIGVAGEIYIGGKNVAKGYLNRPELTREKFIPDSFSDGGLLYQSGDLGRYRADGAIEYLGRADHQIKIRGFRVELGEIEATLLKHPQIQQTCVVAEQENNQVNRLIAFFVPAQGSNPDDADLTRHIQSHLPGYMTPATFCAVDNFPLTSNGKIDRAQLLRLEREKRSQSAAVAPSTPQEIALTEIVKEVLRAEHVGVTTNLFEIGADSLKIFQIASRAAQANIAITPRAILEGRTIKSILAQCASSPAATVAQIKPAERRRIRLTAAKEAAAE